MMEFITRPEVIMIALVLAFVLGVFWFGWLLGRQKEYDKQLSDLEHMKYDEEVVYENKYGQQWSIKRLN